MLIDDKSNISFMHNIIPFYKKDFYITVCVCVKWVHMYYWEKCESVGEKAQNRSGVWFSPIGLATGVIPTYNTSNFCTSSVFGVGNSANGNTKHTHKYTNIIHRKKETHNHAVLPCSGRSSPVCDLSCRDPPAIALAFLRSVMICYKVTNNTR